MKIRNVLKTHNTSCKIKEQTKMVDNLEVIIFQGLGQEEDQHHSLMRDAEGSFKCVSCEQ